MERVKGIEPSSLAWEAKALPLSYTRVIDAAAPIREPMPQLPPRRQRAVPVERRGTSAFAPRYSRNPERTDKMARTATLYRMVLPDHTCPFGVRAKQILQAEGFDVEDNILRTRDEVDAFKAEHGVATTPLIFIDGEQIGGSDDLERYLAA